MYVCIIYYFIKNMTSDVSENYIITLIKQIFKKSVSWIKVLYPLLKSNLRAKTTTTTKTQLQQSKKIIKIYYFKILLKY